MADWIESGVSGPRFTLLDDRGQSVSLAQFLGQPVVLYFYPKDDTPGCTREACAFRDRKSDLARRGAVVLGVSPDDSSSHARFREKFELNFPLLADVDHQVAEAYGAWREKERDGKTSMGVVRSTFLMDSQGKVIKVWKTVQVDGPDDEVLEALDSLLAGSDSDP